MKIEYDTLPARLDFLLDEVGTGAVLKRMEDNAKAVYVNYVVRAGKEYIIAAMVKDHIRKGDKDSNRKSRYEFIEIGMEDLKEWLVLARGSDEVLDE